MDSRALTESIGNAEVILVAHHVVTVRVPRHLVPLVDLSRTAKRNTKTHETNIQLKAHEKSNALSPPTTAQSAQIRVEAHLRGRKRTVTMMFSLVLAASTSGALPAAREEIDEGVVGRAEAVEDGVAGRAEDDEGVLGRANASDGVAGRPPEDEGVVGRAEAVEEGVDGRPPDEVLAGGGGPAADAAGA
ncbi:unnamed protein product [Miscanthus lutarioriparius]|uniref:Uncharacterized protein n=1 Tax=Miscanthus lutarioriparius TaxID=422564 RepID=A0A811QQV0_9POAL|nr:unnamed protein product [Miscanthus lutarioriparius]